MLERFLVQSRGFANTGPQGARTGFELLLRLPSYRGLRASLVDGVDVTVDGERFDHTLNHYVLQGRRLDLAALREASDLRWPLDQPACIQVDRPGGLAAGVHEVTVGVRIRQSYIPIEFQPGVVVETRWATIVLP
ncbi:C-glycoside deglycosidase beta subunit domain-containing protein [Ideonella livida]|uniref:C-deglycosylation enzyme beta subunit n=1 Tax=Ideonella livida TaxID=2707176 RepID=A0A7C9TJ97_9BURK|nr:DUF6379 domain-containing protein [Ideonella livida]NDY91860.1 hypothetical protein [Ideonella livida]